MSMPDHDASLDAETTSGEQFGVGGQVDDELQTAARAGFTVEFDGYAIAPPPGDWGYELDDHGISYGPGWWPFHSEQPRHPGRPARSLRLAPDVAYLAWRNLYALIDPVTSPRNPHVTAYVTLFLGRRDGRRGPTGGGGHVIRSVRMLLDLRTHTVTPPSGLPPSLNAQALSYGERILRFLIAARAERRRGTTRPTTAYERYRARLHACEPAPPGSRIELTAAMLADPDPIPVGIRGVVVHESAEQLSVDWDNGRRLNVLRGTDSYRILAATDSTVSTDSTDGFRP